MIAIFRYREVKDECDVLIESCLYARQAVLQRQVLSPKHLIHMLKSSQDSLPRDLQVRLTLSDAYLYRLISIIRVEACIVNSNLVLVVNVPVATHYLYNVYKIFFSPQWLDSPLGA
jgi:hypothetical protein